MDVHSMWHIEGYHVLCSSCGGWKTRNAARCSRCSARRQEGDATRVYEIVRLRDSGVTLREIGQRMGITGSRVAQLEERGRRGMRQRHRFFVEASGL